MTKLTLEELLLQILSTCLLINAQEKWHAFYDLSAHVGMVEVRITPSDTDYQSPNRQPWEAKSAAYTSTRQHPNRYQTEDSARESLIELLAWTQGYLDTGASA
ncbi:hypothetical protein [Pseudomonas brassicacearum]|uniref:hypothetical protein n=1 Tax=Pseudomonas brassicacearum TaxID=930166 RepID=UPI003D6A26FC